MAKKKITEEKPKKEEKSKDSAVLRIEENAVESEKIATEEEIAERTLKEEQEIKQKKKELGELLVPVEDYLRCGVYIGTKIITPNMKKYIYKKRADGLGILNTKLIDEKIKAAADLLSQYSPEEIIIVCKREAGWLALEQFSALLGIRCFLKKYPAGIITNITLSDFFEPSLVMISDPWLDKNAMLDAVNNGLPIVGLCDTNNLTNYIDMIIPCNNKSDKSLGLIYWILCREYIKKRGLKIKMPALEAFTGPLEPAAPAS